MQGQTIEYVIVDIGPYTKRFPVDPFAAYVALSHSSGCESICLLWDFDKRIFTRHPSDELRDEDERLELLGTETKDKYDLGVIWLWINVVASNKLPQRLFVHVFSAHAPKFLHRHCQARWFRYSNGFLMYCLMRAMTSLWTAGGIDSLSNKINHVSDQIVHTDCNHKKKVL